MTGKLRFDSYYLGKYRSYNRTKIPVPNGLVKHREPLETVINKVACTL